MNSKASWDDFVTKEYRYLLKIAGRFTADKHDLVNHVYLRVIDTKFPEKPMGYFCTAMYMEATRGKFKSLYNIQETPEGKEPVYEPGMERSLKLEQIELFIDRLPWFDKMVIRLYLDGHKLSEVAREADIHPATLYQSLHRTKKILANAVSIAKHKGRASGDMQGL